MSETVAAKRGVTREEYRTLPEGAPYYELVRGELVEMTWPLRAHNRIFMKLARLLGSYVEDELGAELAPEPNLYLPGIEDVYHPDLVYVALEHRSISRHDGIHGTPDMICEILSPTTRRKDRFVKLEDFCRAGVPHVWLVEPERPVAVEEYVLYEGRYRLNKLVEAPSEWEPVAFPGWQLSLAELDAALGPVEENT